MAKDLLDRSSCVLDILNYINYNKNKTLCINGYWGCGKTFILEMLIEEMKKINKETEKKYFPILINSWEYDYYQEPLDALVLGMYDYVFSDYNKKFNNILSSSISTGLEFLKVIALEAIKNKTGIDLSTINNNKKLGRKIKYYGQSIFAKNDLDTKSPLKQTLICIKEVLNKISEEYHIVLIIDELDRCLPEHAIKFLERLHHISNGVNELMVLLALDKRQLSNVIIDVFGPDCDVDRYLAKFINNYINIDNGSLSLNFENEYSCYFNLFNHNQKCFEQLDYMLLNMMDKNIRNWKNLIEEVIAIHNTINRNASIDFNNSLMIAEILYAIIHEDKEALMNIIYYPFHDQNITVVTPYFMDLWREIANSFELSNNRDYYNNRYYNLANTIWHNVIILFCECQKSILHLTKKQGLFYVYKANYLSNEIACFSKFVDYFNKTSK